MLKLKKALIVYFSHTGNTKLIAERAQKELIAANYQVDLRRIEPTKPYPEYGDELRDLAKEESENDNCRPEFEAINVDAPSYDVIFIGTPVWWYKRELWISKDVFPVDMRFIYRELISKESSNDMATKVSYRAVS